MLIGSFGVEGRGLGAWGPAGMRVRLGATQLVVFVVVQQQRFGRVDGRVQLGAGVQVLPVQVDAPGVGPAKTKCSEADVEVLT